MKVVSSWVKYWLCRTMLDDTKVVEALERAGIEVEQVDYSKQIDERVVVALVNKVVQHPAADRLKLVQVQTGEGEYGVVCGAPNVHVGMKVAFAQIGTVLPSGDKIGRAKLRGEVSEGMLCSEYELGIGKDHNGILEVDPNIALGSKICQIYTAETNIDVKTPANRWDVQSVYGLAREIAAMTSEKLESLSPPAVKFSNAKDVLGADIEADRYTLSRIRVSQESPSPSQVVTRLRAAGIRSIGPVVDITNYVMLEVGQPLHAFDAAKVKLPVSVRRARPGETLITLDGVTRKLDPADLVIADATGPIALAGVMGGQSTEISDSTTEILLEAAVFDGAAVRKTAQRHGLRTEASGRIERSLPVALPPLGLARAVELLQLAGGELVAAYDAPFSAPKVRKIALPLDKLAQFLGIGISHKEASRALLRLGIETVGTSHKSYKESNIVVPEVPWWRPDLKEPEDLIEEIVRVVGYDKVPSTIPSWRPRRIEFDRLRSVRRRVRDVLWASGSFEVMTYSFVAAEQLKDLGLEADAHLKLKNPLSSEQAYLRSGLLPSHLATLERNRKYAKAVKFYEISKVFVARASGEQPDEPLRLGYTVLDSDSAYRIAKGVLDTLARELGVELVVRPAMSRQYAPGRYGEILLRGVIIGGVGQLHPDRSLALKLEGEVAHFELDLAALMASSQTRPYSPLSPFPTTERDLALILPNEVTWQMVRDAAADWDVSFVGDYYGKGLPEGHRALTIRLRLAFPDRTPTEVEAAELEASVFTRLQRKLGAQKR